MQKTRYFPHIKKEEISKKYSIPVQTLTGWEATQREENNWRGFLFDRLGLYVQLENTTLEQLKHKFNKKEWQGLWGSLKSTMITRDLVFMKEALSWGFVDYCYYESIEAEQFTDNLELFAKTVSDKLQNLTEFEKYVMLDFIRSDEGKNYIFD